MTFRFIHAADLHLDTPFSGVSVSAPAVFSELRDASLNALDQLVRLAIARDVDFVVIAGDTYDGAARGVRAQIRLLEALQELSDRGIRTFLATGNHDPVEQGWSAIREWPELVTLFPTNAPTSVVVERDGQPVATVHGISHGSRNVTDNLAALITPGEGPSPHIAVLHANVGGVDEHEPLSPATLDDLVDAGIDYWALGHVHQRQVLHQDPWVVYSGSTQARSAAPFERGAKGVYVVEVDDSGAIVEPEFVAIDRVRFDRIEHSIDGVPDLATLRDRLVDTGRRCLAEADGRSVLLQVELLGRGPVHSELYRPGALVELIEGLRTDSLSEPPLLWWDRVDLNTLPVQDLEEVRGRNDFIADLVDETINLIEDEGALTRRTEDWDEELPSDLSHLLEGVAPSAVDPSRWKAAQDLAVDLVAADES